MEKGVGPETGQVLNGIYSVGIKIGAGSFGDIYAATDRDSHPVAVKFEKKDARAPQLRHECKVYRELQECEGVGTVKYFGSHGDNLAMVMDLLGPSLENLFVRCHRRFSVQTTLQLADQLLERVDMMHANHLIHRDIKPGNFVVGADPAALPADCPADQKKKSGRVYAIDFGLSRRFRHPRTLQHVPYRDGRSLTGTPRYASISNHMGIEVSRRDDLESIGYILVYFIRGKLPWQGLRAATTAQKHQLILEKKMSTPIDELCQGCPPVIADFLRYCRGLKFDSKPNIAYLRQQFREVYNKQCNCDYTWEWDWEKLGSSASPVASPAPTKGSQKKGAANNVESPATPAAATPPGTGEGEDAGQAKAEPRKEGGGEGGDAALLLSPLVGPSSPARPDTAGAVYNPRPDTAGAIAGLGFDDGDSPANSPTRFGEFTRFGYGDRSGSRASPLSLSTMRSRPDPPKNAVRPRSSTQSRPKERLSVSSSDPQLSDVVDGNANGTVARVALNAPVDRLTKSSNGTRGVPTWRMGATGSSKGGGKSNYFAGRGSKSDLAASAAPVIQPGLSPTRISAGERLVPSSPGDVPLSEERTKNVVAGSRSLMRYRNSREATSIGASSRDKTFLPSEPRASTMTKMSNGVSKLLQVNNRGVVSARPGASTPAAAAVPRDSVGGRPASASRGAGKTRASAAASRRDHSSRPLSASRLYS